MFTECKADDAVYPALSFSWKIIPEVKSWKAKLHSVTHGDNVHTDVSTDLHFLQCMFKRSILHFPPPFFKSSYRWILIDVSVIPYEHGGQLSVKQKMCGMNLLLAMVVSSLMAGVSGEPFKIRICADISFFNVWVQPGNTFTCCLQMKLYPATVNGALYV